MSNSTQYTVEPTAGLFVRAGGGVAASAYPPPVAGRKFLVIPTSGAALPARVTISRLT